MKYQKDQISSAILFPAGLNFVSSSAHAHLPSAPTQLWENFDVVFWKAMVNIRDTVDTLLWHLSSSSSSSSSQSLSSSSEENGKESIQYIENLKPGYSTLLYEILLSRLDRCP